MSKEMADLLFHNIDTYESGGCIDYYEKKYPKRFLEEKDSVRVVTRLGPSPTGFIHLGNLYMAAINEKLAKQSEGSFYLRIEDTDEKRKVDGAVELLISSLHHFLISFSEGVVLKSDISSNKIVDTYDNNSLIENGEYGPYYQSERREIYNTYAYYLVSRGLAYPCFLTEEEMSEIRLEQEEEKLTPGIYGKYATYRDLSVEEAKNRIDRGEEFVIRFKADWSVGNDLAYFRIEDGIRGHLSLPENIMDVVLIKTGGLPTYHFAHVVDDHLMRTTHVIRGEEWLSSLPIHYALTNALGFELPTYCHATVLMKLDNGKKRKLSKRKDPELSLTYYISEGYYPSAVKEYLYTIINSNFEEWRINNPNSNVDEFQMTTEKMGNSGMLFDLEKLVDVSKDVLVRMPAMMIADFMLDWAEELVNMGHSDGEKILAALSKDKFMLAKILDIGRTGDRPRKELAYARQIFEHIKYFYDEYYEVIDVLPESVSGEDAISILSEYLTSYCHADDREVWFIKVKEISTSFGYAEKPKEYKKNPDLYKGHVGDISAIIRLCVTGKLVSPDIYEVQQIMGETKVRERVKNLLSTLKN